MSLYDLEPKAPIKHFLDLSAIPRGSGNEKASSDFLAAFGRNLGLEVYQDKSLNVIIKKPGTPGYEKAPRVILQGHLDMVCEKNKDSDHDFEKDGIDVWQDGEFLRGRGTTLGADNGVAVALGMAFLESTDTPHPPLTVLMTTGEEVGLVGASALDPVHLADAARLINLDAGGDGVFVAGCAGGLRAAITYLGRRGPIPGDYISLKISVEGLLGGHSGGNINMGRANAIKILGRLLDRASDYSTLLAKASGGDKDNAIPREAEGIICVKSADLPVVKDALDKLSADIKKEYNVTDPGITINYAQVPAVGTVFERSATKKIISAISLMPNGVQHMDKNLPAFIETSLSMGVFNTSDSGEATFLIAIRSSVDSRKREIYGQLQAVAELLNAKIEPGNQYPAWSYREESPLRDVCVQVSKEIFGEDPRIQTVHGGLECGVLLEKGPHLDAVATGARLFDAHSPDERLSIPSFANAWKTLKEILKRLDT